jgi:hypothetical protein
MKFRAGAVTYNTETSTLLQQYDIRQPLPARPAAEETSYPERPDYIAEFVVSRTLIRATTIGFERLYRTKSKGAYWIHERFYKNAGGDMDVAIPLTEQAARAWLKDRFGRWKRFARLEARVFN